MYIKRNFLLLIAIGIVLLQAKPIMAQRGSLEHLAKLGATGSEQVLVHHWYTERCSDGVECIVLVLDPQVCEMLSDGVVCSLDSLLRKIALSGRSFRFEGPCRFSAVTVKNILGTDKPYGCSD